MTVIYKNENYNLYTLVVTYLNNRVAAYPILSKLNKSKLIENTRRNFYKHNKQEFFIPLGANKEPVINYFMRTDLKNWKIS